MHQYSRRNALRTLGISALGLSFAKFGFTDIGQAASTEEISLWMNQIQNNAAKLKRRAISPLEWQEAVDKIYTSTPMEAFKQHLDFNALRKTILEKIPSDRDEFFYTIDFKAPRKEFQKVSPEPRQVLVTKVAHIRKGHSVPPHGHSNMVSAFLCLSGEFEVKLFDRLDNREESMVVRKRVHQKVAGPGTWSSISDYRDNVHWLTAKTDDCFLFTCKMLSVEKGLPLKGRINIDLLDAKQIGSETFLAPKITAARARELY